MGHVELHHFKIDQGKRYLNGGTEANYVSSRRLWRYVAPEDTLSCKLDIMKNRPFYQLGKTNAACYVSLSFTAVVTCAS